MKYIYITLIALMISEAASAQEYYLKPQSFAVEKGADIIVELFRGNKFNSAEDKKIENQKVKSAGYFQGDKSLSLVDSGDVVKALTISPKGSGLYLASAELFNSVEQKSRTSLNNQFGEEGFAEVAEKAPMKQLFSVSNHYYVKSLIMSEKPSGDAYRSASGKDLDIVLLQNPYKMKYGEDVTVQILSKNKPVSKAHVTISTKTLSGSLFSTSQVTDDDGKIYVKLNRAGDWLIKAVNITPAKKSADFDRWFSSYSFSFK